jgi:hypothetical protein
MEKPTEDMGAPVKLSDEELKIPSKVSLEKYCERGWKEKNQCN